MSIYTKLKSQFVECKTLNSTNNIGRYVHGCYSYPVGDV